MRAEADKAGIAKTKAAVPGRRALLVWTLAIGLAASAVFLTMPWLDIGTARVFYLGDRHFALARHSGIGGVLRMGFLLLFVAGVMTALAGLALAWTKRYALLGLVPAKWVYLALSLAIGPGLVANLGLKDHWGRARPNQIRVFAGAKTFTPPLLPADECARNCSFVSGEASAIFALFFTMALMAERRRLRLLALGVLAGGIAGLVRMGQGGHFLSDVIFAGVFMALTALALHWLVFDAGRWWAEKRLREKEQRTRESGGERGGERGDR